MTNNSNSDIAIFEAVKQGNLEEFRRLWCTVDTNIVNIPNARTEYLPFLHFAAKCCPNVEIIRILIEQYRADINVRDKHSWTPLHWAASRNSNVGIVRILVEQQETDVNARNKDGYTPLHFAVSYTHDEEVFMCLVNAEADVNAQGTDGCTPLHHAASHNSHVEVLEYLVNAGANVNAETYEDHRTPLDNANTEEKKAYLRSVGGKSGSEID